MVKGHVTVDKNCELVITDSKTLRVKEKNNISGNFEVSFIASGPFPANVDIQVFCNGEMIKEMKNVNARSHNVLEMGKVTP